MAGGAGASGALPIALPAAADCAMAPPGAPAGLWLAGVVIAAQLHCAIPAAAPQTWEVLAVAAGDYGVRQPLAFRGPLGCYGGSPDGVRTRAPLRAASCAPALCRAPRSRPPTSRGPCMLQDMHAAELEVRRRGGHGGAWSAPRRALPPCAAHGSFSRPQPQGLSHGRGRGGRVLLAALSTSRKSELILKEVKTVDGVDVNIKLESLGGSRRRISGGCIAIPAPCCEVRLRVHFLHPQTQRRALSF